MKNKKTPFTGLIVIIILITVLFGCKSEIQQKESINGTWKSIGSGWFLEIKDSTQYAFYDGTKISCLANRKGNLTEMIESIILKRDTLFLLKGAITYSFIKVDELPKLCNEDLTTTKTNDPLYNFEVFAETVKEHYAFFELNGIDWDELYLEQTAKLSEKTTKAELYLLIEETLEKLNDNHAFLEATDDVYVEVDKLLEPEEEENKSDNLPEYGDFQVAKMVAEHHLEEEMTEDSSLIQWGKLNDSIGFIQIKSMWLYADLKIPKPLIKEMGYVDAYVHTFHKMYEGDYVEKEVLGVREIMDKVMNDLSNTKSIVIDIRFNGGGQDAVSFEILNRFVSKKIKVATQKLRYGDKHSPMLPVYIQGTENAYTRPVYILTSTDTGSAAESFSMATMAMENVKRIGSSTSGAISTALEKTLPNGWSFTISNEVYTDNNGNIYENIGVPPDYEITYSKDRQTFFRSVANDLEKDKKNILNAINELQSQ